MRSIFVILVSLFLISLTPAFAGLFSMNAPSKEKNQNEKIEKEIPVQDSLDKLILRRREEAHKLIAEARKLIKKGEKKKDQNLIMKGQIKKEIGEKQLQLLKEQVEKKKQEDAKDEW